MALIPFGCNKSRLFILLLLSINRAMCLTHYLNDVYLCKSILVYTFNMCTINITIKLPYESLQHITCLHQVVSPAIDLIVNQREPDRG